MVLYDAVKMPITTRITMITAAATGSACKSVMITANESIIPMIFAESTAAIWNIAPMGPALKNESNMRKIADASIRKYVM